MSGSASTSGTPAVERPPEWPWSVRVALVALAYFVMARLGLMFATVTANISPVWPPSGLAVAALLIGGVVLWPGVALGALAGALSSGATLLPALLMATGNTAEALVTVVLLRRWFGFRGRIDHPRQVVGYLVLLGGLGVPLSTLCGTLAAWWMGPIDAGTAGMAALTWAGGHFTGGLVVGPLLIAAREFVLQRRRWGVVLELAGLVAALGVVGGAVFLWGDGRGIGHVALLVLPFPLLVWAAWRFAIGGTAMAVLLLGVLAVWGTVHGQGPFGGMGPHRAFGHLLTYVAVIAITSFLLAAFNAQREGLMERLRQRDWQLSEAQRIANFGVWVWDTGRADFRLSDGGRRILGLGEAAFVQRLESFLAGIHPEDRGILTELLRRVSGGGKRESCEVRVVQPDKAERHVVTTCMSLGGGRGGGQVLLGTVFDLTERKRSEDEREVWHRKLLETQKLESLGLLAGGIAHDFNNLLTGMLGNASLLRLQLPEDSAMHEGLRRIEASAERAADLCRQMLAYSGKGRFVVREVDLNELVRGTLGLARNSVPKKAEISFLPGAALPRVRGDLLQLRQVLLNLVVNAAEALPETGGRVTVRTAVANLAVDWFAHAYLGPNLAPGDYVLLEVADTGGGVDPAIREKIFEPFFSTKFTGRGLGLAAVAGIVRAHAGAVRVGGEAGQGAVFRVVLPAAEKPAKPEVPAAEVVPAGAPPAQPLVASVEMLPKVAEPGGGGTWLVVDDEAAVRQVAAAVLATAGLSVAVAGDGMQALELFGSDGRGLQAVLLDLSMPRLGGVETFQRLRQRRADIPVVLMSGYPAEEALERFAGLGITGFLQKPFSIERLRLMVAEIAGGAAVAR